MKNNIYILVFGDNINWLINENDPKFIRFKSNRNYAFINPIYYKFPKQLGISSDSGFCIDMKNQFFISTNFLLFKKYNENSDNESIMSFVEVFVNHIKLISKQFDINPNLFVKAQVLVKISALEKMKAPNPPLGQLHIRRNFYETMVTMNIVRTADKNIKNNFQYPIYSQILLDAYVGLRDRDYRKTILYAAISIESMLGIELDKEYDKIKNQKSSSRNFRVSKFKIPNEILLKDPIYQFMKDKTKFENLLHELPLYILNKSILLENEKLYRSAKKLYSTRNKIVHSGEPDNSKNIYLTIDENGAKEAILIAIDIFNWMNINDFNFMISDDIIQ